MGSKHLRLALAGPMVAALLAVLPAAASAKKHQGPPPGPLDYVAIGDSYTASALPPVDPAAPPPCGRSQVNYPHLVAKALGLTLTDVSCSGAQTKDITESQFPGQPPQDTALSAATDVVTIGMGGNDNNVFGTLVTGCTQIDFVEQVPGDAPCKEALGEFVREALDADRPPEEAALVHVHELAPNATVFVVGYPEITPQNGSCAGVPWTEGDLRWFRDHVSKPGDRQLEKIAKRNGAIFVDTFKPSKGHDACQAPGVRWIEPIFGSLSPLAFHPNAMGEEAMAAAVEEEMGEVGIG